MNNSAPFELESLALHAAKKKFPHIRYPVIELDRNRTTCRVYKQTWEVTSIPNETNPGRLDQYIDRGLVHVEDVNINQLFRG